MERELFALRMEEYRTMVEDLLDAQCVAADEPYARLLDAMRYSLTAGGKRLRKRAEPGADFKDIILIRKADAVRNFLNDISITQKILPKFFQW